jgi:sigma-B regulation protein RsbU (phosphoserine phosphatase)
MGDSGQFMTLFYLVVDSMERTLSWVRAGHDPAILYDPNKDAFETLYGIGIALGVDENWQYEEKKKTGLADNQTIVIGTDGIWEACNSKGEMFGKAPLYEIIRQNPHANAAEILDKVIEALDRFQEGHKAEDDITLIVIRVCGKLKS